jgi:hypothetical protein
MIWVCATCGGRVVRWGEHPNGQPVLIHSQPARDRDHQPVPKETTTP